LQLQAQPPERQQHMDIVSTLLNTVLGLIGGLGL
jgi:hypothetical protein